MNWAASHQPGTSSGERRLSRSHSIKVPSAHAAAHTTRQSNQSRRTPFAPSHPPSSSASHYHFTHGTGQLRMRLGCSILHCLPHRLTLEQLSAPRVRRWHSLAAAPGEPLATARLPREGTGLGSWTRRALARFKGPLRDLSEEWALACWRARPKIPMVQFRNPIPHSHLRRPAPAAVPL